VILQGDYGVAMAQWSVQDEAIPRVLIAIP
jgi:hypothetical protein